MKDEHQEKKTNYKNSAGYGSFENVEQKPKEPKTIDKSCDQCEYKTKKIIISKGMLSQSTMKRNQFPKGNVITVSTAIKILLK